MRIIKLLVVSLVILVLVITALSFIIPSNIRISRTVRIQANKEAVMLQLKDPVKWKKWYPGADSVSFLSDSGIVNGFLFHSRPDYSLIISDIRDNEVVALIERGNNKEKIILTWRVYPENNLENVTLQWYMDFHLKWYPWQKFSALAYDKYYGSQMDAGLLRLRNELETK